MEAPKNIEIIFERKQLARRRFDGMTLIEKIEIMAKLRSELEEAFGWARRERASRRPNKAEGSNNA